jgi:hypothetical protein
MIKIKSLLRFLPRREAVKAFVFGLPRYDTTAILSGFAEFFKLLAVGAVIGALLVDKSEGYLLAIASLLLSLYLRGKVGQPA